MTGNDGTWSRQLQGLDGSSTSLAHEIVMKQPFEGSSAIKMLSFLEMIEIDGMR
jgi:hypothetical protein